jgi:hypothetical protein
MNPRQLHLRLANGRGRRLSASFKPALTTRPSTPLIAPDTVATKA